MSGILSNLGAQQLSRWLKAADPVRVFRRVVGAILAFHFSRIALENWTTLPVHFTRDLTEAVAGPIPWGTSPEVVLVTARFLAGGLSLWVALGPPALWITSILLALCTEIYWAGYPVTQVDDHVVHLACLLILLIDLERSRTLHHAPQNGGGRAGLGGGLPPSGTSLGGLASLGVVVAFNCSLAVTTLGSSDLELGIALGAASVALILETARWVPLLAAAGAYLWLGFRSECWIATALLTAMVACSYCVARRDARSKSRVALPTSAGALIFAAIIVTLPFHAAGRILHWDRAVHGAGRLLAMVGVAPPAASWLRGVAPVPSVLEFTRPSGGEERFALPTAREQTVALYLVTPEFPMTVRGVAAHYLANRVCTREQSGPYDVTVRTDGAKAGKIWFICERGKAVNVVPLLQDPFSANRWLRRDIHHVGRKTEEV